MTLAALSTTLGASTGWGSHLPWDALSRCPSTLSFPCCPPEQSQEPQHTSQGVIAGGSWAGGRVDMWGGETAGICPWSAPACLEPSMLRLFLLSHGSIMLFLQPKPLQPHSRAGCSWGAWAGSEGLSSQGKREDDLGANLELAFPKSFQTPRLLAGSVTAPASLSSSTMSFPWQGQQWGKNNTQKTRDM